MACTTARRLQSILPHSAALALGARSVGRGGKDSYAGADRKSRAADQWPRCLRSGVGRVHAGRPFSFSRRICGGWCAIRKPAAGSSSTSMLVRGQVLGVVGYGGIGQETARLARALGMQSNGVARGARVSGSDPLLERVFAPNQSARNAEPVGLRAGFDPA